MPINNSSNVSQENAKGYEQYVALREDHKILGAKLGSLMWHLNNPSDTGDRFYFNHTIMKDLRDNFPYSDGEYNLEIVYDSDYPTFQTVIDGHVVGFHIHPGDSTTYQITTYIDKGLGYFSTPK